MSRKARSEGVERTMNVVGDRFSGLIVGEVEGGGE